MKKTLFSLIVIIAIILFATNSNFHKKEINTLTALCYEHDGETMTSKKSVNNNLEYDSEKLFVKIYVIHENLQ